MSRRPLVKKVPQANETSILIFLSINLNKTYLDLGFRATLFKITKFTKRTHSHLMWRELSLNMPALGKRYCEWAR